MKIHYLNFRICMSIFLLITGFTFSQENIKTSFEASEGKVFIYYEFEGDSQQEYNVNVKLKRSSDPSFELTPSVLVGDVGKGTFAGKRRTIIWQINPQEEKMLSGSDFYFEVLASKIEKGGGVPWYVFVGGAVLAGGAAAFLLLNKKSEDNNTTTTQFPAPPSRP